MTGRSVWARRSPTPPRPLSPRPFNGTGPRPCSSWSCRGTGKRRRTRSPRCGSAGESAACVCSAATSTGARSSWSDSAHRCTTWGCRCRRGTRSCALRPNGSGGRPGKAALPTGKEKAEWLAAPTTRRAPSSCTGTSTSGTRSAPLRCAPGYKLVDPDGLVAEPEYDLGIVMREDPVELLAGVQGSVRTARRPVRGWTPPPSGSGGWSSASPPACWARRWGCNPSPPRR